MDDSTRREERNDRDRQHASHLDEDEGRDELAERREQSRQRKPLTDREREDRWPIG